MFIEILLYSLAISLVIFYGLFKLRYYLLGKSVLETKLWIMEPNKTYEFGYRHSLFNNKQLEIKVLDDGTSYVLKETTYYNYRRDVSISVFKNSIIVYTLDLKNIIYEYRENLYEEEEN